MPHFDIDAIYVIDDVIPIDTNADTLMLWSMISIIDSVIPLIDTVIPVLDAIINIIDAVNLINDL